MLRIIRSSFSQSDPSIDCLHFPSFPVALCHVFPWFRANLLLQRVEGDSRLTNITTLNLIPSRHFDRNLNLHESSYTNMSGATQSITDHERQPLLLPEHDERAVLSASNTIVDIQTHHEHTSSHTTGGGAGVEGEGEGLARDGPKYDRLAHHREMVRERFSANWWIEWIIIIVSYRFRGREQNENDKSTCSSFMIFSFPFLSFFTLRLRGTSSMFFFPALMLMLQNTTPRICRLLLVVTSIYL